MSDPTFLKTPYDSAYEEEMQHDKEHCMCGIRMDQHTMGDGHSPVSMYDYYSERARREIELQFPSDE